MSSALILFQRMVVNLISEQTSLENNSVECLESSALLESVSGEEKKRGGEEGELR